jgi:class 3 adenylate cyclase
MNNTINASWKIKAIDPSESWKITVRESKLLLKESYLSSNLPLQCPFTAMKQSPPIEQKNEYPHDHDPNQESSSSSLSKSPVQCPASLLAQTTTTTSSTLSCSPRAMKEPCITGRQMKQIFPYHIVVNKSFHIIQVGVALPPLLMTQEDTLLGQNLPDILHISRPVLGHWEWKSLRKLEDQTFFVDPLGENLSHIKFKANIIKLSDDTTTQNGHHEFDRHNVDNHFQVMLVLSPDVKNVSELRKMNLTMSDLPLHSFQRDAVFLGEHIVSEVKSAHKLDQLSKKLRHEQNLSKALLHTLLPPHVADEMRMGKAIQPELHENVTIFFSDIVGFTSICDEIFPWDCIDLLNRLYCIMDFLSAKFNIYKIETIGDSYLCASGLLSEDPKHADNIANFAIAVLHCLPLVRNPVTGQPLQLRIGIHTGPVMTGVVGMSTPHYCVFGDAVNTASRHESTGVPGKIQCSSITYGLLEHFRDKKEYHLVPRGLISMKGKGLMATYFLEGATEDNTVVHDAALKALYLEVEQMISVRRFTNKRYFKRYGKRMSETYLGSFGGSMTEDDFSESNEASDEDDEDEGDLEEDDDDEEEEEEEQSLDDQQRQAELEVFKQ